MISPIHMYGLKVLVADQTQRVGRTWKERLFSRPWRPLQKWKLVPAMAHGQILRMGDTLVMSSSTRATLERQIELVDR